MALEDNDKSWMQELENALLEEENDNIGDRSEAWQANLGVLGRGNQLLLFNDVFDLPQQNILREECQNFVDKLGNEDEDKVCVVSDLESILTFYCKSHGLMYEQGCGWVEMLLPLLSLKLPRSETYNLFEAICSRYIPRNCKTNETPFHLFRLLLQYHDPELCSFLDTKRISPDKYCLTWFQSLFAAACNLQAVLNMWDVYFQHGDPFLVFFLGLIIVINYRDEILKLKNEDKQKIVDLIISIPCGMEAEDVNDFCSLAQFYAFRTPSTFRRDLSSEVFGASGAAVPIISQALCLPVSAQELIENAESSVDSPESVESVRFFLVDCRPADQYNAGHLPTAFHLDSNLMLQEPAAFTTAVQGLLSAQKQALAAHSAAGGEHLCFLGSGRVEEDQYTHMVVSSFLQKHTSYVSMLHGGYQAIHAYFGTEVPQCLEEHNPQSCLVCVPNTPNGTASSVKPNTSSSDLLGKISAAMKSKSAEMKDKLFEYIVNPTGTNSTERHVSSTDKLGKRYRNIAPVFSIDDDQDGDTTNPVDQEENESQDVVFISMWLKKPEVIESFTCFELKVSGSTTKCHLLATKTHMYVLREIGDQKGYAHIIVSRPLSAIVKITSRKKYPKVITFKYGVQQDENIIISDMDRFYIPNAKEVTELITRLIMDLLQNK